MHLGKTWLVKGSSSMSGDSVSGVLRTHGLSQVRSARIQELIRMVCCVFEVLFGRKCVFNIGVS